MTKHSIERSRMMKNGERVTIDLIEGQVRVVAGGTGTIRWFKINQMREALAFFDKLVQKYVSDYNGEGTGNGAKMED